MLLTAALVPISQLLRSFTLPLHLLGSVLTILTEPLGAAGTKAQRGQSPSLTRNVEQSIDNGNV